MGDTVLSISIGLVEGEVDVLGRSWSVVLFTSISTIRTRRAETDHSIEFLDSLSRLSNRLFGAEARDQVIEIR